MLEQFFKYHKYLLCGLKIEGSNGRETYIGPIFYFLFFGSNIYF